MELISNSLLIVLIIVIIHSIIILLDFDDIDNKKVRKLKFKYFLYCFFKPLNVTSNKKMRKMFDNEYYKDFY
jgi:hypothetical protein